MIANKNINIIIAIIVVLALCFTIVFTYMSDNFTAIETHLNIPLYQTKLFSEDVITVNIIVDKDKWTELLKNATKEEYIPCDIVINGIKYENV